MTHPRFTYETLSTQAPLLGLIALQSDETIEHDMRRLVPMDVEFMVSRVPSDEEVTADTLAAMEGHLQAAAALFPSVARFDAIGYGCTSGTAQIGVDQVAAKIRGAVEAEHVTQPLSSLVAACEALGVRRLALLSPYVSSVSDRLRSVLSKRGLDTPVFGSFEVSTEALVARVAPASIEAAAVELMSGAEVDALFISCTNLRTLDVIAPLEMRFGKPVLSSNQVLAWHMLRAAGAKAAPSAPGRLFRH